MDFTTIQITEKQLLKVPNESFKYGTWQSNYFIPINIAQYDETTKKYWIGVSGWVDKLTVARYLKINAQIILLNNIKKISYSDFMNLENF